MIKASNENIHGIKPERFAKFLTPVEPNKKPGPAHPAGPGYHTNQLHLPNLIIHQTSLANDPEEFSTLIPGNRDAMNVAGDRF